MLKMVLVNLPQGFLVPARSLLSFFAIFLVLFLEQTAADAATPRNQPSVGSILSATGDSQIRFIETENWLTADIEQDLLTGDGLRTGSLGTMALLFADRTQVRVQRNSTLTVKSVAKSTNAGSTLLRLDKGGTWSRAVTGGSGVQIETPSATAAIRGTDWSLNVDEKGSTQLIVLDGEVILENPFGRVSVKRGEIAFAEIGKAPTKTILVNPRDREQQIYDLNLVMAVYQFFKLTDLKRSERRQEKKRIETVAASERSAKQWIDLAELSYDLGDLAATRLALQSAETTDAHLKARAELVAGYLSFTDLDFASAEQHFSAAESKLDLGRILHARIGRTFSLLQLRKADEAKSLIDSMQKEYGKEARFLLFKVILTTFSGDFQDGIDQARKLAQRFPDNSDFPAVEGVLSLILARSEQAKNAAERTLELDPENPLGYIVLCEYKNAYLGDSEGAIELLQQGLSYNENDAGLWGWIGFVSLPIGEYRQAEEAFLKAIGSDSKDITDLINYSVLLLDQYRIEEAREMLDKAEQIDPNRDVTKANKGRLALQTDNIDEAQQNFLEATTLNPAYSYASTGLAITYYQNRELARAEQALDNAARMNPNSPEIPLIGSVIASDRAYADRAIEYARDAIRLYRQRGGIGVTGLASTRGGNNTLGAAYSNLGLSSWADYYNELSFNPYSAESHFFRAVQDEERFSSLYQGLLLEPLATSSRSRFVDFFRRPFTDVEIGGSVGWPGDGASYGGAASIRGFSQTIKPISYYVAVDHGFSPGDRDNADKLNNSIIGSLGINLTPYDRLFLDIEAVSTENGLPGTASVPDFDDDEDGQVISAGLGYSHYFGPRNIILGRILAQNLKNTFSNEDPLGSTPLSTLDYSLLYNFGVDGARLLYGWGLSDDTNPADPNSPILTVGGQPFLANTIPPGLDSDPKTRFRVEDHSLSFNFRHMFTISSVDFNYGAELKTFREKRTLDFIGLVPRDPGKGLIVTQNGSVDFLFGDPARQYMEAVQHGTLGNVYIDALWRINNNLWLEGSLFADHADNEYIQPVNRLDPRAGIAWQASNSDWLRLVFREDVGTTSLFSLAPVATVGLKPRVSYTSGINSRITSYIARWDREWTTHFFTSLEMRRQDIHDFTTSVPDNNTSYYVNEGRIDQASLSANLWLRGGFGLFARAVLQDSENLSAGADNLDGLPLIPDQQLDAGIAWIHPLQIRVNLVASLVGERSANDSDNTKLDSYGTVGFSATWQPLDKHLELGLTVTNLLDRDYEAGQDMVASGRNVLVIVKWRF
ncbi:MAG: FecR domain-containing protein [Desulfobulbaceae bacterium]|nr:FecR domain-containing protein [Desulfobulbaceae bacterium]